MILFKNIAVLLRSTNKCMGITRTILSETLKLRSLHQLENSIILREKHVNVRNAERAFCTHSKQIVENSMEDLLDDLEEEEEENPREEGLTTEETFQEIAAGDAAILKKLKLLEFEVAILREGECKVPDRISKNNWKELLEINSVSRRKKFLSFLRLNELKKMSKIQKSLNRKEFFLKYKEECGFHYYGLSGHSMFMRIYERDINRLLIHRLMKSKLKVLLDCSYQEYMSPLNTRACATQIFYTLSESRLHRYPCQVELCNLNRQDALGKILPNYVNGIYDNFYAGIHEESYLDLYPKEKLVYLSPHSKCDLHKFNHDDIYIIGAFVDKGTGVKASLAKAKQHKIRMAKFPIDEYLFWKKGTKSLPLNIVLNVLLDMAFYNDWNKAFKNLPSRCLTEN